ncbi:hypothetical protein [Comamonas thiooxydans]|uniref:hypothetical protein n=1 Tax=Comamonas thiooxydans TaxID=363952 RepID=UPI001CCE24A2|nr:hypothetical protein [Comamonas thiooxydans]UBQ42709.1 hypothetical protein LCH15_04170 [Comamonas thiooxydans]
MTSPAIAKAASPTGISQASRCMTVHQGAANAFTAARSQRIDESSIGYLDKNHTFPNQKQLNTKDYQQQTKCR